MTREEAIYVLNELLEKVKASQNKTNILAKEKQALEFAIEALKEMSVEEYRQRLMEVFHSTDHDELLTYVVMPKEEEFKSLEDILRQYKFEPRQHGEWEFIGDNLFKCTHCGYIADADYLRKWKVHKHDAEFPIACLKCGADMRKEGEAE